jgi:transcriptional regulator with XRE-family HTH domain
MNMKKNDLARAKVNIKMTPGEMLKTLRELQELSQSELAELSGMSQSNISALESEARQIGRERALALAIALKVHPAVILFPDFDLQDVA